MCERLYKKIKNIECESNLYISNNKVLFETIYNLINEGVPVPSAYYINHKLIDRETERYVLTRYIYDVDDIIYKVEAHTKMKLEKHINLREQFIEEVYLKNGEVEDSYVEDKYNALDSLQIYVSHPNFESIWNDSTMSYFINCYHDEQNYKILTHILEKEEFGYDLQIELFEIPQDPVQTFLIANHLSKIREALQCGPLMHFLFTKTTAQEDAFEKIKIRQNEIIYILKKNDYLLVVISIHYDDEYDKYIALGLCKNIHFATKAMDLSGNLDCSFYVDFPSHLITSEYFVYDKEMDKENYVKEKRYLFKKLKSKNIKKDERKQKHFTDWKESHQEDQKGEKEDKGENGVNSEESHEKGHEKGNDENQTENKEFNKEVNKEANKEVNKEANKEADTEKKESVMSSSVESSSICSDESSFSDGYMKETEIENKENNNGIIKNDKHETEEKEEEDKIPNVGFMALKMDIKLFKNCKIFSELIQISSRTSNIIVSFRDFLNNAIILYRIKQRRTFSK